MTKKFDEMIEAISKYVAARQEFLEEVSIQAEHHKKNDRAIPIWSEQILAQIDEALEILNSKLKELGAQDFFSNKHIRNATQDNLGWVSIAYSDKEGEPTNLVVELLAAKGIEEPKVKISSTPPNTNLKTQLAIDDIQNINIDFFIDTFSDWVRKHYK